MSVVIVQDAAWQAILADERLAAARRKLSFHEIRLIVQHARDALQSERASMEGEIERLRAERDALLNPPKHKFWGAGERDCPREIKAGNGELHTLRCKVCGLDDPRDNRCLAALTTGKAE